MEGNGAVDYLFADGSEGELEQVGLTVEQCIAACPQPNCTGFKTRFTDNPPRCFLRSEINLGDCATGATGQDTWVYVGSPSPNWVRNPGLNCMEGYGAVDYLFSDGSEGELRGQGLTVQQCIDACPQPACKGFKYKPWDTPPQCFL